LAEGGRRSGIEDNFCSAKSMREWFVGRREGDQELSD
jgi:hypothetical protein